MQGPYHRGREQSWEKGDEEGSWLICRLVQSRACQASHVHQPARTCAVGRLYQGSVHMGSQGDRDGDPTREEEEEGETEALAQW